MGTNGPSTTRTANSRRFVAVVLACGAFSLLVIALRPPCDCPAQSSAVQIAHIAGGGSNANANDFLRAPIRAFVDVGAFTGDTLRAFLKLVPNAEEYELYGFECQPENLEEFKRTMQDTPRLEIIPMCVGIENGTMNFTGHGDAGAVLDPDIPANKKYAGDNVVTVPTINLAEFMLRRFTENDFVVLKIDVEGAEFAVMPHLFETGAIRAVKKLQMESHSWIFERQGNQDYVERQKRLYANLETIGLHLRYATFDTGGQYKKYSSWEEPEKYLPDSKFFKDNPWSDHHFTRDGIDWVTDW